MDNPIHPRRGTGEEAYGQLFKQRISRKHSILSGFMPTAQDLQDLPNLRRNTSTTYEEPRLFSLRVVTKGKASVTQAPELLKRKATHNEDLFSVQNRVRINEALQKKIDFLESDQIMLLSELWGKDLYAKLFYTTDLYTLSKNIVSKRLNKVCKESAPTEKTENNEFTDECLITEGDEHKIDVTPIAKPYNLINTRTVSSIKLRKPDISNFDEKVKTSIKQPQPLARIKLTSHSRTTSLDSKLRRTDPKQSSLSPFRVNRVKTGCSTGMKESTKATHSRTDSLMKTMESFSKMQNLLSQTISEEKVSRISRKGDTIIQKVSKQSADSHGKIDIEELRPMLKLKDSRVDIKQWSIKALKNAKFMY